MIKKEKTVITRLISFILLLVMVITIMPGGLQTEAAVREIQPEANLSNNNSKIKLQLLYSKKNSNKNQISDLIEKSKTAKKTDQILLVVGHNFSRWNKNDDGTYNSWVESRTKIEGEQLIDYYQYEYALFFDFNVHPTKIGKGSAIFLHVKSHRSWKTAGCVSLTRKNMIKVITGATSKPYIIIVPNAKSLKKY